MMSLGTLALLWPSPTDGPSRGAAPSEPPAVQIEHQLIRAAPAPSPQRPRARLLHAVNRLAVARTPAAQRPENFAVRAGRLLMGDGRYRPEPFPRPGR